MTRSTAPLAALLLVALAGCAPPEGAVGAERGALTLSPVEVDGRWLFELANEGEDAVRLGCEAPPCESAMLRHEALQPDGAWVERPSAVGRYPALDEAITVASRDAVLLGAARPFAPDDVAVGPGTYRAVVTVRTAEGATETLAREYARVGWDETTLSRAEAIRADAEANGCFFLEREMDDLLLERLEPDALEAWHEQSRGEVRGPRIRGEMIARGGFVDTLVQHLAVGALDDARDLADALEGEPEAVQRPVREAVAARLTDLVPGRAAMDPEDYERIRILEPHWPQGAAESLVRRLERGPDEDEALTALIRLFVYVSDDRFEGLAPRIRAGLAARCEGATDGRAETCEDGQRRWAPGSRTFFGTMRGSSRCGGVLGRWAAPACAPIRARWNALVDEAGEVESVWL